MTIQNKIFKKDPPKTYMNNKYTLIRCNYTSKVKETLTVHLNMLHILKNEAHNNFKNKFYPTNKYN